MTFHSPLRDYDLAALSARLVPLSLDERIRRIRDEIPGRLVLTTSFGLEDQVLTHAIAEAGVSICLATLDTGRLFDETLETWAETELRYGVRIEAFTPDAPSLERLLVGQGPLGFRRSIEARQACCGIRKVEPLGRALAGATGWLTGLRAGQSANRAATSLVGHDGDYDLVKVSPLADWDRARIETYVRTNGVPHNPLHGRGFSSIGCAPCTRAVQAGESERAGRWWWRLRRRRNAACTRATRRWSSITGQRPRKGAGPPGCPPGRRTCAAGFRAPSRCRGAAPSGSPRGGRSAGPDDRGRLAA